MVLTRILDGLEQSPAQGDEAQNMARLGFLEWVLSAPEGITVQDAKDALQQPHVRDAESAAAQEFVNFLEQATLKVSARRSRRKRTERLH
ncbi:hypothetical protein ROA7450_00750 [Roseovarius albus]|uniref:Uncharacterized protein n=1 Tax=Roseovarius albus TaxID=1247867 RepID=A0A1X6YH72_9RHOB|nr:hypothetical protein [Roseovarius albus]SLN21281.1 hypothetical protein ROA7450_00750 [Roseovarius albus]